MVWYLDGKKTVKKNEREELKELKKADPEVSKIVAWALQDEDKVLTGRSIDDDQSIEVISLTEHHLQLEDRNEANVKSKNTAMTHREEMGNEVVTSLSDTSGISSDPPSDSKIEVLRSLLRSIEARFEMSVAANHEIWKSRFESMEKQLESQSQELTDAKEGMEKLKKEVAAREANMEARLQDFAKALKDKDQSRTDAPQIFDSTATALTDSEMAVQKNLHKLQAEERDEKADMKQVDRQSYPSQASCLQEYREENLPSHCQEEGTYIRPLCVSDTSHFFPGTTLTQSSLQFMIEKQAQLQLESLSYQWDIEIKNLQTEVKAHSEKMNLVAAIAKDMKTLQHEQGNLQKSCDTNFEILVEREHKNSTSISALKTASILIQDGYEKVVNVLKEEIENANKFHESRPLDETDTDTLGKIKAVTGTAAQLVEKENQEQVVCTKLAHRKAFIAWVSSDTTDPVSNIHSTRDDSSEQTSESDMDRIREDIKKECRKMIEEESEHMMKTWGAHFQDLTTLVQNDLDALRDSILEVRTSTFEHVDAETKARAMVWNAQYNQLVHQLRHHDSEILNVKEDQERSTMIVVETMVNLKVRLQELGDELNEQKTKVLQGVQNVDFGRNNAVAMIRQQTQEWCKEITKLSHDLSNLKGEVKKSKGDVAHIMQEHELMHSILNKSIDLFDKKLETNLDIWSIQLNDLHQEVEEYVDEMFAPKQDYDILRKDFDELRQKWSYACQDVVKLLDLQTYTPNDPHFFVESSDDFRNSDGARKKVTFNL